MGKYKNPTFFQPLPTSLFYPTTNVLKISLITIPPFSSLVQPSGTSNCFCGKSEKLGFLALLERGWMSNFFILIIIVKKINKNIGWISLIYPFFYFLLSGGGIFAYDRARARPRLTRTRPTTRKKNNPITKRRQPDEQTVKTLH